MGHVEQWVRPEDLERANAEKGPSRIEGHEEKARMGSSTPAPEISAVRSPWQRKTEDKDGGSEGTRVVENEGAKRSI